MKTIQLSASLSRNAGGIFEIELAIAQHLQNLNFDVEAYGLSDSKWKLDAERWPPVDAKVFETQGPIVFGYAPQLLAQLLESDPDLVHLHYMWKYPSVAVRKWSKKTGLPYIVTPNGMLEPWALINSSWKKKLAGICYENAMLRGAACLQANTKKELNDIRIYGLKNAVCIIPNGIDLPKNKKKNGSRGKKKLIFLGRIHPKKGLVNAMRAWKSVSKTKACEEWQFIIAGWDQGGHESELKTLCAELGLVYADLSISEFLADNSQLNTSGLQVIFVGPAFGSEKEELLRSVDAFVLPSFSEGLPMSVLEAWSYRLPVLMTDYCNISAGFSEEAALRINTDTESISKGLISLFEASPSDLQTMGNNGYQLVATSFTWPMVAAQMKEVYEWVLGGGDPPETVNL